jgi:hypothetical protein
MGVNLVNRGTEGRRHLNHHPQLEQLLQIPSGQPEDADAPVALEIRSRSISRS